MTVFQNLPFQHNAAGARAPEASGKPFAYEPKALDLSDALLFEIRKKNAPAAGTDPLSRLGGGLAMHCRVDLDARRVTEAAAMATLFRGYETLLRGRDLKDAGLVSSTASGICGGVHATASALCLEMALAVRPPPLGIVVRNLLLSCQYLNDNPMHLFILSGPDYSEAVVRRTNPAIWERARTAPARHRALHGFATIGALMTELNRPDGALYLEAMQMVRRAREAYALLGGKYPHSESIVPGGVTITPTREQLTAYARKLEPFFDYAKRCVGIWDEVFDFLYQADPRYRDLGRGPATIVDFGQWDNEEHYDASYARCDDWGRHRWSTPGAVVDGKLVTTRLSDLNVGLEEFVDHSYYEPWPDHPFRTDPLGNPLGPQHPWNKTIIPRPAAGDGEGRYSWGTALTWDRRVFEVGAYARMYLSALAGRLPRADTIESTGESLKLELAAGELPELTAEWRVPPVWNAFERNRARAYAIAFNLAVTMENCARARALLERGEDQVRSELSIPSERRFGAGFWGAGRGFLAHWAVIEDGILSNYQIATPSRVNAAPRTPWGAPGPCEQALLNTPIIEDNFRDETGFSGIDVVRAIQSFDPCMPCSTHLLIDGTGTMLDREITTSVSV